MKKIDQDNLEIAQAAIEAVVIETVEAGGHVTDVVAERSIKAAWQALLAANVDVGEAYQIIQLMRGQYR